jgi:WD40 repeat protein
MLASGGMDKCVRVWDTATGAALHELSHDEYVLSTSVPWRLMVS